MGQPPRTRHLASPRLVQGTSRRRRKTSTARRRATTCRGRQHRHHGRDISHPHGWCETRGASQKTIPRTALCHGTACCAQCAPNPNVGPRHVVAASTVTPNATSRVPAAGARHITASQKTIPCTALCRGTACSVQCAPNPNVGPRHVVAAPSATTAPQPFVAHCVRIILDNPFVLLPEHTF